MASKTGNYMITFLPMRAIKEDCKVMANKSNWKGMERDIAAMFGTERNPLSGSNSKHSASDSLHKHLFIECKKRTALALHGTYRKAKMDAEKESKIPIVATKETGKHINMISFDVKDFPIIAAHYFHNNPSLYQECQNLIESLSSEIDKAE